uniref:Uncharacterized protein n=1 Tax=Spongospora subterranea TaxID=70186 RepID=A0A0H5QQ23_9EUKA|eukprot:CRZ03722.1 hypothetical protein [Spongospora subterranea]
MELVTPNWPRQNWDSASIVEFHQQCDRNPPVEEWIKIHQFHPFFYHFSVSGNPGRIRISPWFFHATNSIAAAQHQNTGMPNFMKISLLALYLVFFPCATRFIQKLTLNHC